MSSLRWIRQRIEYFVMLCVGDFYERLVRGVKICRRSGSIGRSLPDDWFVLVMFVGGM
jgi:hypothetical protein